MGSGGEGWQWSCAEPVGAGPVDLPSPAAEGTTNRSGPSNLMGTAVRSLSAGFYCCVSDGGGDLRVLGQFRVQWDRWGSKHHFLQYQIIFTISIRIHVVLFLRKVIGARTAATPTRPPLSLFALATI